jgi:radical SAM protein with 4Fe4S-binding SPASM domain
MYINSSGDVYPCCNHLDPAGWGNVDCSTLKEIWNGEQREAFLDMMLSHERNCQDDYPVCNGCNIPDAVLRKEDSLDEF